MIQIQQLKMPPIHNRQLLQEKIAAVLSIKFAQIQNIQILRKGIDARKKPTLFVVYHVSVSLEAALEEKIIRRNKNSNISVYHEPPSAWETICGQKKPPLNQTNHSIPCTSTTTPHDGAHNPLRQVERPIIIGTGPAGLFCGYYMAKQGLRPILIEQGKDVDARKIDVESFWKGGALLPYSNVAFGEGGAGTFSDGKLTTLTKDRGGRNRAVLELFVTFGAKPDILWDAKPHLGTDILHVIMKNLRQGILDLGGEIRFESRVSAILTKDGAVEGVEVSPTGGAVSYYLHSRHVVVASGHSARESYFMLGRIGVHMTAKPFAVGLRIIHPQAMINRSQYGEQSDKVYQALGAASYKLTAQVNGYEMNYPNMTDAIVNKLADKTVKKRLDCLNELSEIYNQDYVHVDEVGLSKMSIHVEKQRGVYTFCMCPGGYVVNASTTHGETCINGMSYANREGEFANSAVIVTIEPNDFHNLSVLDASDSIRNPDQINVIDAFAGIFFQQAIERNAFKCADGDIPLQTYSEFYERVKNRPLPASQKITTISDDELLERISKAGIKGTCRLADLSTILPSELNLALVDGIEAFGRKLQGFNSAEAILAGVESRTSSPVRIVRDENCQTNIVGLYSCGEGAGYAGGIMSAAADGLKVGEAICTIMTPNHMMMN
ncbi:MAG: FAD-dependent oxidoreductase [Clostridium sp.]|jgi:uncharacterized FAD-dependent dehydrogenase|nr:FAD-dependent oxidoreductase [Clostridium sp.]